MMASWALAALFVPPLAWAEPAAVPGPGEPALELTLEKAVALGLERNLDMDLAEERLAEMKAVRRQAIGLVIPDVTVTAAYSHNFKKPSAFFGGGPPVEVGADKSMRGVASLQQTLFSGGVVRQGLKAAQSGVEAGREGVRAAKEDVTLEVKRLFYAVCLASETAAIQRDSLATAEEHLRTIEERFRQGLDSDLAVLRQKVEVANARPALNAHEISLAMLKDALGLDVDAAVRLTGGLDDSRGPLASYEALRAAALAGNPDFQVSRRRFEAAEALLKVARGARWPEISLYADYQWYAESAGAWPRANERATSSLGGLRLSYPFFRGGETAGRIDRSRAQRDQARSAMEKSARLVRLEVKRQWLSAQEAIERARSVESAVSQARRALEATETRYRAGEAGLLEQNDAALALQRARLLHAEALHDYRAALAALERAAGTPAEEAAR